MQRFQECPCCQNCLCQGVNFCLWSLCSAACCSSPHAQRNRAFSYGRHPRTLVALNLIGPLTLVFGGTGRRKRMLDLFGIPRYSSLPRVEPSFPRCVVRKERAPAIRPSQRDSTALDTAVLSYFLRAQCCEFLRLFDLLFSYCQKFISARFVRATLQFFSFSLPVCALDLALDTFGETPGCCLFFAHGYRVSPSS